MKSLKYKGYIGSIEVDVAENLLFGKLLFIRDLVSYQASTPEALKAEFESAVDDYLTDCEEQGLEPDVPCKGSFNVRIEPELHRELAIEAKSQDRSLNDYVEAILSQHDAMKVHDQVRAESERIWQLVRYSAVHEGDVSLIKPRLTSSQVERKEHYGSSKVIQLKETTGHLKAGSFTVSQTHIPSRKVQ